MSIAIVGMTAVAALESVGAGMRAAEKARRAMEAEALASSRMEQLDLLTDRELQALPDSVAKGTFPEPLTEYSWATTSEALADPPGIFDVRIDVTWTGGAYTIRTYQYRVPRVVSRR